jgi:hypothetical protein
MEMASQQSIFSESIRFSVRELVSKYRQSLPLYRLMIDHSDVSTYIIVTSGSFQAAMTVITTLTSSVSVVTREEKL